MCLTSQRPSGLESALLGLWTKEGTIVVFSRSFPGWLRTQASTLPNFWKLRIRLQSRGLPEGLGAETPFPALQKAGCGFHAQAARPEELPGLSSLPPVWTPGLCKSPPPMPAPWRHMPRPALPGSCARAALVLTQVWPPQRLQGEAGQQLWCLGRSPHWRPGCEYV